MKNLISFIYCLLLLPTVTFSIETIAADEPETSNVVDYDIVYVRYDIDPEEGTYVKLSQGEDAYSMEDGADLILLKPDGSEVILVDCETCSVYDPTLSFDGKTVYYTYVESEAITDNSWLYKIKLDDPEFTPIRLTFNDGFDSKLYAANTSELHYQSAARGIRDMSPIPLADGRLLFTSNRSALTAFGESTSGRKAGIMQMYTMTDHDGELTNGILANITRLEAGTLHLAQHPIQLKDGRILFSTWQDAGQKFSYAMTSLFTVHPDGTNLQQFTEPHNHRKFVEHFVTQLADEQVITGSYYPSFDFGFGVLLRYPLLTGQIQFQRTGISNDDWSENRDFSRKEADNMTPHTIGGDQPAPEIDGVPQGKYAMPSVSKAGDMLVAYSSGYVNHFNAVCSAIEGVRTFKCEDLKSGIYIIENAQTNKITNKDQLILVKDDPNYNELWPKPVLSYQEMYGVEKPTIIPSTLTHPKILKGETSGLIGTSSMYNRETSSVEAGFGDPFKTDKRRETAEGSWTIQGTDVGEYTNDDIYGVRIISTTPKPFTKPITKWSTDANSYDEVIKYAEDNRNDDIVARYGSLIRERWEILGEFPLTNKETTDAQGNPDSSWVAKIPAETPFIIQTIDKNGMTLNSELTWRALKSGEVRTDCGGCHAHSVEPLAFETTQAHSNLHSSFDNTATILSEVIGIDYKDARVKNGLWDLTTGAIPVLTSDLDEPNIAFVEKGVLGIEFRRDVLPIINEKCLSCHTTDNEKTTLVLDGTNGKDAYDTLVSSTDEYGITYQEPQMSRYIRVAQARQSLLAWVAWGQRLDGRTNESRAEDLDYTDEIHTAHQLVQLTDDQKRTVARWIDLGSPIDFPHTDGMGYTDDNQLPLINIAVDEMSGTNLTVYVGVNDVHSAIDWSTLKLDYFKTSNTEQSQSILACVKTTKAAQQDRINGVATYNIAVDNTSNYIIRAEVSDVMGNKNIITRLINNK